MANNDDLLNPQENKSLGIIFFYMLAALLLNIVLGYVAAKLNFVIFLDTIFTVAITFYAGLLPGIIVAILYNPTLTFILCLENGLSFFWYDGLYCLCGVVIVLITWLFSRNKKEFLSGPVYTILYLLLISFCSAMASCFTASFLDTFIRPFFGPVSGFGITDIFYSSFRDLNISDFFTYLLSRIPITVLDRLLCTFTGFIIFFFLKKGALK